MYAVAPGIVRFASVIEGMGGTVVLDHGDGYHTVYARLLRIYVEPFDPIAAGAPIGEAGAAVFEELPEAYFEVRVDGIPVDPALWLAPVR
jgi:septal ring factor EnvC (AmiA/AmiB activator)